jgi:polynucleotide 5'-hydroxyl-kinase GRC3/NOL9
MPITDVEEFITDGKIFDAINDRRSRVIMVIGESDTGKSTLVLRLSRYLSRTFITAIIDADIGQSHIGPPTTVAWGLLKNVYTDWTGIQAEDIYFAGALSPSGNIFPVLVGAKKMTEKALNRCEKAVVDTTGMIEEPEGRLLKQYKIDLLDPSVVLALEHTEELRTILAPYEEKESPAVIRLKVPEKVGRKGCESRTKFRNAQFQRYFSGGKIVDIPFDSCAVHFSGHSIERSPTCLLGAPVSFRDSRNSDRAIGIIEGVQAHNRRLLIRTGTDFHGGFSHIVIGSAKIRIEQ